MLYCNGYSNNVLADNATCCYVIAAKNNINSSPFIFSAHIILPSLFRSSLFMPRNNTRTHYIGAACLLREATEDYKNVFVKSTFCVMMSHSVYGFLNGHQALLHTGSACCFFSYCNHSPGENVFFILYSVR